jgi:hypothetical protein
MPGVAFVIAVIAAVLAVWFWFQGQSAVEAVKGLQAAAESSRKEAEVARAEQKKAETEVKARGALLQETREKLVEARRKSQEGKPKAMQPRGAREAELEEDLAHARRLTSEAHATETAARRDLASARLGEAQIKNELAVTQAKLRELAARPAVPAPAAAPVSESAEQSRLADELAQQRTQLEAARSELDRQVQQAEKNAREAKRRELELRDEVRKMRGRAETNNRVYLVTKGELELTKERLASAERKLWQAGIPLTPPPSKERPKATGPAAADKAQEGATAAADAAAAPAASPAAALASGEPISAGEAAEAAASTEASATAVSTTPPEGIAPIRRRPPDGAADKPQS